MTHAWTIEELVSWLRRVPNMPGDCAAPIAGAIAHYTLRRGRPHVEDRLRSALDEYVGWAVGHGVSDAEFDDILDGTVHLLHAIERARGGDWPIGRSRNGQNALDAEVVYLHRVRRAEGKHDGRAPTDENLLVFVVVRLLEGALDSRAAAIEVAVDVIHRLGVLAVPSTAAAARRYERAKKAIGEILRGLGVATEEATAPPELTHVYRDIAASFAQAVTLPIRPAITDRSRGQ